MRSFQKSKQLDIRGISSTPVLQTKSTGNKSECDTPLCNKVENHNPGKSWKMFSLLARSSLKGPHECAEFKNDIFDDDCSRASGCPGRFKSPQEAIFQDVI